MTARPLVSAAIIVRDEADHLRRCLTSIAALCDEIVVVDTGSTDESLSVADSFGARTDVRPWDDDFAAARNHALAMAAGRWILYIDADEELSCDAPSVRSMLAEADDVVSFRVWFRSRRAYSPYLEYRLWRHRDDIRFHGRIHETMVPDIHRVAADTGLRVIDTDTVRICHYGYEGDQTAKHHRNLPLLERRVAEYPDRCYLWNHLGNVRNALGDRAGARQAWQSGVDIVRRRGIRDRTDVLCFAGLGLDLVSEGIDISELVDELGAIAPWYLTRHWMAARNAIRQGRDEAAIEPLRLLIHIGPDPFDPTLSYNNSLFTEWAWSTLAEVYLRLGRITEAAAVYESAAIQRPDDLEWSTRAVALRRRAELGVDMA